MSDVQYVKALEIAAAPAAYPAPKEGETEMQEGIEQSFLNAKSLVSFVSAISGQQKSDVLNSVLLAQLAANKKFPNEEQILDWYALFIDTLNKLGWTIEAAEFSSFESSSNIFEVENAIIDILTTAFGGPFKAVITKTLGAIKNLSDANGKIRAFEKNTHSMSKGAFQIGLATAEGGSVALQLGSFLLTSSNEIKKILFFKSTKDKTRLDYSSRKGTLNEDVYGKIRQAVLDKLGNNVTEFISEIDI